MKRYEYRLVKLMFAEYGNPLQGDGIPHLQPGERIIETFSNPEPNPDTGNWSLPVLTEREIVGFPTPSQADLEELTARLKGEFE